MKAFTWRSKTKNISYLEHSHSKASKKQHRGEVFLIKPPGPADTEYKFKIITVFYVKYKCVCWQSIKFWLIKKVQISSCRVEKNCNTERVSIIERIIWLISISLVKQWSSTILIFAVLSINNVYQTNKIIKLKQNKTFISLQIMRRSSPSL